MSRPRRPRALAARLAPAAAALLPLLAPGAARAQQAAGPPAQQPAQRPAPQPGARPGAAAVPQAAGQLVGRVVGAAAGQAVAGAGVTVRNAAGDTALVAGALTRADGSFRVDGLRPGRYTVRVRALGFAPLVRRDVAVTAAEPRADLGRLPLAAVAVQLTDVQVRADRATEVLAPDRNSYSVKDMPATSGGTAVDVLRNVPAVEVDGDNNVSLRGNPNVVVQINGRVSPMRGQQLGNFLAQLPANVVAKVEVVSNPSAKNDPEGLGGIVNIVLKQEADLGTSGGLAAGGGSTAQATASANVGRQSGPWTLFASYGFMRDRRTVSGESTREIFATAAAPRLGARRRPVRGHAPHVAQRDRDGRVQGDRARRARGQPRGQPPRHGRGFDSFYRASDAAGAVVGQTDQRTDQSQGGTTGDLALTWRRTLVPRSTRSSPRSASPRGATTTTSPSPAPRSAPTARPPAPPRSRPTARRARARPVRAERLHPRAAPRHQARGGLQGHVPPPDERLRRGHRDGRRRLRPRRGRSNAYTYGEAVHAAYGVLSQRAGRVDLQAGLRLEQADANFDLATTGRRYDIGYRSAFPSALASFTDAAGRNFKASYSKRISRPDVRQLNPFGFREDQYTVFEGNPGLRPEYTHAYELGYQQPLGKGGPGRASGTLQLTPFLRHTVSAVRQIGAVDDAGILRLGFRNAATVDQYGADVNLSVRRGRLSAFGGGSAFQQVTDASNLGTLAAARLSAFAWSARANATVKVTPALDLQAFGMYRSPTRIEQGRLSRFALANLALKQKLRGDHASVTLRVADPLGTMGWAVRASDGRVQQTMDRHFGARGTFLNFAYNFGQAPRIRPRPQDAEQAPGGGGLPGAP
jgi:outer membrane receptor protein involved in Fe transport